MHTFNNIMVMLLLPTMYGVVFAVMAYRSVAKHKHDAPSSVRLFSVHPVIT